MKIWQPGAPSGVNDSGSGTTHIYAPVEDRAIGQHDAWRKDVADDTAGLVYRH